MMVTKKLEDVHKKLISGQKTAFLGAGWIIKNVHPIWSIFIKHIHDFSPAKSRASKR